MPSVLYSVVNFPTKDQALCIEHEFHTNFCIAPSIKFITTLKTPSSFHHLSLLALTAFFTTDHQHHHNGTTWKFSQTYKTSIHLQTDSIR